MAEIRKHTLNFEAALTAITIKHGAEREIVTKIHKDVVSLDHKFVDMKIC